MSSGQDKKNIDELQLKLQVTSDELNHTISKMIERNNLYETVCVELESLKRASESIREERLNLLTENTLLENINHKLEYLNKNLSSKLEEFKSENSELKKRELSLLKKIESLELRDNYYREEIKIYAKIKDKQSLDIVKQQSRNSELEAKIELNDSELERYKLDFDIILNQFSNFQKIAKENQKSLSEIKVKYERKKSENKHLIKKIKLNENKIDEVLTTVIHNKKISKASLKDRVSKVLLPKNRKHEKHVKLIEESNLFDTRWYLKNNIDVAISRFSAAEHFVLYGHKEGREPSPLFSCKHYRKLHEDVAKSGVNPLLHYVLYGQDENRAIKPNKY